MVKIAPRNSHEPNSRDQVGVLALPAQPRRLRQRFFHHRGGVDEHLDLAARGGDQPSRQRLQPFLDQVVIIVALRIDRDRAACPLLQDSQRIFIRPVIDTQHDHRTHARPQHARIGAAFRMSRKPIHLAMLAGGEESVEMPCRIRDRIGIGNAHAIEPERARFASQRGLQFGSREREGCVQKSRST